ncbi:sulfurtransferase [Sneathiella chungangensis]|uniref:Sulfurtransferase n=1 Tax=Sneathiella chungangensis TaxID=1418234 RepID=A0A845MBV9_9PROT|nr:rhodanese-like domain-containing protein [Sneathiella chungangensis]MZR21191.1 sulfurtransferase [Sneathiella chungangensis]
MSTHVTTKLITADELKARLAALEEFALLDVREAGEFGEGHMLFASNCPYSRLELDITKLVPNRHALCVLCDGNDGVADRAAVRLNAIGYENIRILHQGMPGWEKAGFSVFKGINVPSKILGELIEKAEKTPTITPDTLSGWQEEGRSVMVIDGRPFSEHAKFTLPGSRCIPNGEFLYRKDSILTDPELTVVIHCAGRTRGLVGVQSLIDASIENPVFALENGTQGWALSGRDLVRGKVGEPLPEVNADIKKQGAIVADRLAASHDIPFISAGTAKQWFHDKSRTTYLLDVRTHEEFDARHVPGSVHAPAVQIVQATDEWIAVRNSRVVLIDDNGIRATSAASRLKRLGYSVAVMRTAFEALGTWDTPEKSLPEFCEFPNMKEISAAQLKANKDQFNIIDVRPSSQYREKCIPGSSWSIRPKLDQLDFERGTNVVLISDNQPVANLAALDIQEATGADVYFLVGGLENWEEIGGELEQDSNRPSAEESIDYLYFVHDRHYGNMESARQYIAWEIQLIDQLDNDERQLFQISLEEEATHG